MIVILRLGACMACTVPRRAKNEEEEREAVDVRCSATGDRSDRGRLNSANVFGARWHSYLFFVPRWHVLLLYLYFVAFC